MAVVPDMKNDMPSRFRRFKKFMIAVDDMDDALIFSSYRGMVNRLNKLINSGMPLVGCVVTAWDRKNDGVMYVGKFVQLKTRVAVRF